MLVACLCSANAWAAETAIVGGMDANYSYDDNVNVVAGNKIALAGLKLEGFGELQYRTPRLDTKTRLTLGAKRNNYTDLESDNPLLKEPDDSDFDYESYNLNTDVSYAWERHTLGIYGRIEQDSNINTQFADGGLGGLRQVQGSSNVDTTVVRPTWGWQLTERQYLQTTLQAQFADYQSDRYVNYDYYSAQTTWFYSWSERIQLQVRPLGARFENAAQFSVTTDTYGLEAGVIWSINEKVELNVLGGITDVSTDYGGRGFFIFDPETGQPEFIELEDENNNGFSGSGNLSYKEELYGFSATVNASYSPSSNGYLQEDNRAGFSFYWTPRERLRFDLDTQVGMTDTSGNEFKNKRTFGQGAVRASYQFAQEWWLSGRYRYREQDYDRNSLGSADGNLFSVGVSYKLPKDIL